MHERLIILALSLLLAPQVARAQAKPEAAAPPPPPITAPPPATSAPPPSPAQTYIYDPAGRRDPFTNLVKQGTGPRITLQRGEGKAGLSVAELTVRGIIQSRGGYVATVQGPDGKTFIIHPGDKLADGVVRTVNAEGIIVVQEVNDPLSLVRQREVSKKLRSLEAK